MHVDRRSPEHHASLGTWLREASRWVGWGDIAHLLSPIAPLSTVVDFMFRHDPERLADSLEDRDPAFIQWLADGAELLGALFRLEVHGLDNLPRSGPAMLVGNHNGGLLPMDGLFTLGAICRAQGPERAVHPLAHDLVLYDRVAHRFGQRMGILRAGHDGAARAFAAGHMVLVYPGSDLDTFRPWKDRHTVELGGRTGFLRCALRHQVPIIPVLATGTHEQWIVLTRGDRLARLLHTGRLFRTKVLPLALALPFGLTPGLLPYLPLPAQTTLAFGRPLTFPELGADAADDPAALARCYVEVGRAMQVVLDAMSKDRVPFIGQPAAARAAIDRAISPAPE